MYLRFPRGYGFISINFVAAPIFCEYSTTTTVTIFLFFCQGYADGACVGDGIDRLHITGAFFFGHCRLFHFRVALSSLVPYVMQDSPQTLDYGGRVGFVHVYRTCRYPEL